MKFDSLHPFRVTAPEGKVKLVIMNASDGLPAAFALMGTRAQRKVALRLGGGCKGMNQQDKLDMLEYFSTAFAGYDGLIWSGSTRQVTSEGQIDPMITDVPGVIAAANKDAVALGTCPRIEMLTLQQDSRLVLDEWGTVPNPDMAGILIVQNGPDGAGAWDGDVATYFRLMESWRDFAGFTALGLITWNGGQITQDEIMLAAKKKWPVMLVRGSGRATDEVADKLTNGDKELLETLPTDHRVTVVQRDNPESLRKALFGSGFLATA